jgi:hypothetical protein
MASSVQKDLHNHCATTIGNFPSGGIVKSANQDRTGGKARIERLLVGHTAVHFDKKDHYQPVGRLTIFFFATANRARSSGSAVRARSSTFPSHNGALLDLASARSSFSHFSWHILRGESRRRGLGDIRRAARRPYFGPTNWP